MKRYELFLLFIFLCICLECKYNEKNIRKLDVTDNPNSYETEDYNTDFYYSDTGTDTNTDTDKDTGTDTDTDTDKDKGTDTDTDTDKNTGTDTDTDTGTDTDTDTDTGTDTDTDKDTGTDTDIGTQANLTETTPKPRMILLGFGNFQNFQNNTITFNVFFKRIYIKVYLPILYLTIRISNNNRLRNLEEVKKIKCKLDDKNNNTESYDIKYNCQDIINLDHFTSISVEPKIEFGDGTVNFTDVDVPITSNANKDIKNIQNAKADLEKIIILENSTKTQNEVKFFINGYTSGKLNNGSVTLYLEENGYDGKKNISCILNGLGNNNYKLECIPKTSIFARLDNTEGKTFDNQSLLISMLNDKEEVFFDIPTNKYLSKISSNNGLTGGAIAAIVICCVVAIISIVIISVLLNMPKNNKSPPVQMSSMEMYGSDANINNNKL